MTDRAYAWKLAADANDRLAARDSDRAEQVEWTVDTHGNLKLRDRAGYSSRHKIKTDLRHETERKDWHRRHEEGQFERAVPINETMDF